MPGQVSPSKLPFGAILKKHAKDQTTVPQDYTDLPGGITGGVAQLRKLYIGTYSSGPSQGKDYLRGEASVVQPRLGVMVNKEWRRTPDGKGEVVTISSQEMVVQGLSTSTMVPLCATGKGDKVRSEEDNVADALNLVRLLGGPDCTACLATAPDPDAMFKQLLQAVMDARPFFKFGTRRPDPTKDYPSQRTWETWYEACDGPANMQEVKASGVQDSTGSPSPAPHANGTPAKAQAPTQEASPAQGEAPPFDEFGDLDSLVARATAQEQEAIDQLTEFAKNAGWSEDEVVASQSWEEVKEMIMNPKAEGQPEAPPDEPWAPKKDDVCKYLKTIIDPKTKQSTTKLVDVIVTAVSEDGKTFNLQEQANRKNIVKAAALAKLSSAD